MEKKYLTNNIDDTGMIIVDTNNIKQSKYKYLSKMNQHLEIDERLGQPMGS